jgi:hypothetical protein
MAIMCVGCGAMFEREDISGHFASPTTGVTYPKCPACAGIYGGTQSKKVPSSPPPPQTSG